MPPFEWERDADLLEEDLGDDEWRDHGDDEDEVDDSLLIETEDAED